MKSGSENLKLIRDGYIMLVPVCNRFHCVGKQIPLTPFSKGGIGMVVFSKERIDVDIFSKGRIAQVPL